MKPHDTNNHGGVNNIEGMGLSIWSSPPAPGLARRSGPSAVFMRSFGFCDAKNGALHGIQRHVYLKHQRTSRFFVIYVPEVVEACPVQSLARSRVFAHQTGCLLGFKELQTSSYMVWNGVSRSRFI